MPIFRSRLYVIIDPLDLGVSPAALAGAALAGGALTIQLRWKSAQSRDLVAAAEEISSLASQHGAHFIVNDRTDIALATDAAGVHLGQEDLPAAAARALLGPKRLIGLSTHNPSQVEAANQQPIDYLGYGPIFPTSSKKRLDPVQGLEGLRLARSLTDKPMVAIGGITEATLPEVLAAGADCAAIIGDIMRSGDIGAKVKRLIRLADGR